MFNAVSERQSKQTDKNKKKKGKDEFKRKLMEEDDWKKEEENGDDGEKAVKRSRIELVQFLLFTNFFIGVVFEKPNFVVFATLDYHNFISLRYYQKSYQKNYHYEKMTEKFTITKKKP